MVDWENDSRPELGFNDAGELEDIGTHTFETLRLADGNIRLEVHEEKENPGQYYAYLVRMSGPLPIKDAQSTDKEATKRQGADILRKVLIQALRELWELYYKE